MALFSAIRLIGDCPDSFASKALRACHAASVAGSRRAANTPSLNIHYGQFLVCFIADGSTSRVIVLFNNVERCHFSVQFYITLITEEWSRRVKQTAPARRSSGKGSAGSGGKAASGGVLKRTACYHAPSAVAEGVRVYGKGALWAFTQQRTVRRYQPTLLRCACSASSCAAKGNGNFAA
ncbi:hypothetical protein NPIL_395791 [Nephila pilipes]|uniref:Uncharacterized protein n=1 Tax=Nephila pilipes TaxID=299642 RepID=A0A8X6PU84_NEPPI|nr:hypothetical protein NPIL_395791 [Nephila pilipes]